MSYEYLKHENVVPVALAEVVGRIEEHNVDLSPEDEVRAMRLHEESIIIDFHNHVRILPKDLRDFLIYSRSGRPAIGYEGIKRSGMSGCLYGFGGSFGRRCSPTPWQFEDLIWDLGMQLADMAHHRDVVVKGDCTNDILQAKKNGRTAIIPMIENAGVIYNDLDRLDVLYGLGIKCMGLSYNHRNTICDGVLERNNGGMSSFGLKVIERMNRLGILIDFSHSSDRSLREGMEASEIPCCLTHAIAKGVYDVPKGRSDKILEFVAERDGVIGVEAVPNITSKKEIQTVFDVIDHVDYIVRLVGVDHVAIGTDTLFGDHVALHKAIRGILGTSTARLSEFPATHIEYIENPGQLSNVTRALVARGYSGEDIRKIMGGNVLRILKQAIG